MSKFLLVVILIFSLAIPASAAELTAPTVPQSGAEVMPEKTDSFGDGLLKLLENALGQLQPDLKEASRVSLGVVAAVMMVSLLQSFSGSVKTAAEFAGTTAIAAGLLLSAKSLIRLAAGTVTEISEYGKLLLPVMTAAMAAQGGVSSSAALYTGTALFDAVLSSLISRLLVPMVYLFLALAWGTGLIWGMAIVYSLLNVGYVIIQDSWTFPRTFDDYEGYRKRVPFLIPTAGSLKRAWDTRR